MVLSDIHLASFFSQHRPISISHVIPPSTTSEDFSTLFDPAKTGPKPKIEDVIETLSFAVESLDESVAQQEGQNAAEQSLPHEDPSIIESTSSHEIVHSSKPLHINLQDLAKSFRPFVPPPPPVPLATLQKAQEREVEQGSASWKEEDPEKPRRSTYTTTLTVYETIQPDGSRSYKSVATPMLRTPTSSSSPLPEDSEYFVVADGEDAPTVIAVKVQPHGEGEISEEQQFSEPPPPATTPIYQPFLERMRERQRRYYSNGGIMHAISVRRQRKLKMKKHKYKKLMKRTRNLRKKLERG